MRFLDDFMNTASSRSIFDAHHFVGFVRQSVDRLRLSVISQCVVSVSGELIDPKSAHLVLTLLARFDDDQRRAFLRRSGTGDSIVYRAVHSARLADVGSRWRIH